MVRILVGSFCFLVAAAPASAALIVVTSDREVAVSALSTRDFGDPETIEDSDEQTSILLGPFSAFVDTIIAREGPTPLSTAEQTSDVGSGGVTATGSATARGTGFSDEFDGASSGGVSKIDLVFDVAAPTPYSVALTFTADASFLDTSTGFFNTEFTLGLQGGATLVDIRCSLEDGFGPEIVCRTPSEVCATSFDPDCGEYELAGVLAAGRYELSLSADASSIGSSSVGMTAYDLAFTVPEPRLSLLSALAGVLLACRRRRASRS